MTSGDNQTQPLTAGRSHHSVTSASPSTYENSPLQPHSPDLHSANNVDVCTQDNSLQQDDHTIMDEQYIKVCSNITATHNKLQYCHGHSMLLLKC